MSGRAERKSPGRLGAYRRIVVKIGSSLLVDPASGLKRVWLATLAADIAGAAAGRERPQYGRFNGVGGGAFMVSQHHLGPAAQGKGGSIERGGRLGEVEDPFGLAPAAGAGIDRGGDQVQCRCVRGKSVSGIERQDRLFVLMAGEPGLAGLGIEPGSEAGIICLGIGGESDEATGADPGQPDRDIGERSAMHCRIAATVTDPAQRLAATGLGIALDAGDASGIARVKRRRYGAIGDNNRIIARLCQRARRQGSKAAGQK